MTLRRIFCFVAVGIWLLTAQSAGAQGSAVVEGIVRGPDHKPMPHVVVILKSASGQQVDRTITNLEGHYLFFQVPAGTFVVTVEPEPPYQPDARRVEILPGELEAHRREDFQLDALPGRLPAKPTEPLFVQQVPPEAEKAYTQGMDLLRAGKKAEGQAELRRSVELFPEYYLALNQLGLEALQRGEIAETEGWLRRAVAVNANSASGHFGLGWARYESGHMEDADRELRLSIKLNPRIPESHFYLGMVCMEQQKWADAETAFQSYLLLKSKEERPQVHLYLTSVYDRLGRPAQAAASLRTYLNAVPPESRTQRLKDLLARLEKKKGS